MRGGHFEEFFQDGVPRLKANWVHPLDDIRGVRGNQIFHANTLEGRGVLATVRGDGAGSFADELPKILEMQGRLKQMGVAHNEFIGVVKKPLGEVFGKGGDPSRAVEILLTGRVEGGAPLRSAMATFQKVDYGAVEKMMATLRENGIANGQLLDHIYIKPDGTPYLTTWRKLLAKGEDSFQLAARQDGEVLKLIRSKSGVAGVQSGLDELGQMSRVLEAFRSGSLDQLSGGDLKLYQNLLGEHQNKPLLVRAYLANHIPYLRDHLGPVIQDLPLQDRGPLVEALRRAPIPDLLRERSSVQYLYFITGKQANDKLAREFHLRKLYGGLAENAEFTRPFREETTIAVGYIDEGKFLRVSGEKNSRGAWFLPNERALYDEHGRMLSRDALKKKFALPEAPSKILTADLERTIVYQGFGGKAFGEPGGLLQVYDRNFIDRFPLREVAPLPQ